MKNSNNQQVVAKSSTTRQNGNTPTPVILMCYNRNCYKTFANAKGLSVHISKSASCREFVSQQNLMTTINRSFVVRNGQKQRRVYAPTSCGPSSLNWYNTQGQRLNPYAHLLPHLLPSNPPGIGQSTMQEPGMDLRTETSPARSTTAGTNQYVAHQDVAHKDMLSNNDNASKATAGGISSDDDSHSAAIVGSVKRTHEDVCSSTSSTPGSAGTIDDDDDFMVQLDACDHHNYNAAEASSPPLNDDQRFIFDKNRLSALSQVAMQHRYQASDPCLLYSQAVFNATMECARAKQHKTLQLLQHDVEHKCIVELVSLLESMQCPDYALEKVLQWAHNAQQQQFSFTPRAYTREANVQWMYKLLRNSHQHLPFIQMVDLEDHTSPQKVVCFDFGIALLSLLQDQSLMQLQNLVINPLEPLAMFQPNNRHLGDANTGQRYRDLYADLITDAQRQLLVPIILYLDGTTIDGKGHLEVCPVSFTCSLFTEEVRRSVSAWRMLGYVPDLNRLRSNAMNAHANKGYPKGRTTRNLHKIMDAILGGMRHAQQGKDIRLMNVPIKIGEQWLCVDIVCPLLFVINDGKQGDQLCGRYSGHHRSTIRHHRSCNCCFDDLDNPDITCSFLVAQDVDWISQHGSDDDRHQLSPSFPCICVHDDGWNIIDALFKVDNCFNRIEMGSNPHGIFMCAIIDVMHTVQHGVVKYALEVFLTSRATARTGHT